MSVLTRTRLVDEIRTRKLSRNHHFELLSQPEYRAAMRLGRYLDGVAGTIRRGLEAQDLQVEVHWDGPERLRLLLRHVVIGALQQVHLHRVELACLLRHHPDLRSVIPPAPAGGAPDWQQEPVPVGREEPGLRSRAACDGGTSDAGHVEVDALLDLVQGEGIGRQ